VRAWALTVFHKLWGKTRVSVMSKIYHLGLALVDDATAQQAAVIIITIIINPPPNFQSSAQQCTLPTRLFLSLNTIIF
jgi:hypothetical protein